jgi:hypothetical protein
VSELRFIEEEIYTHEYLWRSASVLIESAEVEEKRTDPFLLPSLLMSFMAYEAFVNFCGFVLLPELWKDEKKYFKGKGTEGKLKRIADELPDFLWQKGESPYQEIKGLESFRDTVSHGKVMATEYLAERREDGSHFQFNHTWDIYLSVNAVKKARGDIKKFCQSLLIEVRKVSDHKHLPYNAFEGTLASARSRPKEG